MEYSVDRIREWLSQRYGADVQEAEEVIRRASAILSVLRQDSAADVVAICHRIDADREYERDPDGKFAVTGGGGGSGESRPAGSGVGAAQNHHEIAAGHAERARSAASGTTASARASARKAEEHAALAKVAAEHDDHKAAEHHAKEAERHAVAAQMKASVHRGESPTRPGRPTTPVENKPMVEIVTRPKTAEAGLTPKEAAATAKAHEVMKQATRREELRAVGKTPAVAAKSSQESTSDRSGRPTTPMSDHQLAKVIQKAVDEAPGRHGHGSDKVYIHRAHEATQGHHGLSLEQFKSKVADLGRQGHIQLARADVLGMMNRHDLTQSHVKRAGGGEANFIQRTRSIPQDQIHHPPSTTKELDEFRSKKLDFHGREIGEPTTPTAPVERPKGDFNPQIGGKISVGGWNATLERVTTGADGAKTYHTSSGRFSEEHIRKHNAGSSVSSDELSRAATAASSSAKSAADHRAAAEAHAAAAEAHGATGDKGRAYDHTSSETYHRSEARIAASREQGRSAAPLSAGKNSRIRK